MDGGDDDNWLNARRIDCPSCDAALFQVDRSPMEDAWRLYCDRCPKSASVSFYDKRLSALRKQHGDMRDGNRLFTAIETELRGCDCGGTFLFRAPKRCYRCESVVAEAYWVDVSPLIGAEFENRDPTGQEQAAYDAYHRAFVREDDLWRPDAEERA